MKLLSFALVVCACLIPEPLLAAGAISGPPAAPIAVFMIFDRAHSGRALDAMKQEAELLTRTGGLQLVWRMIDDRHPDDIFSSLVVVRFHGECSMEGETGPGISSGPLGFTHTSDGQVLPYSQLECDRIHRSIAPLSVGAAPGERETLMGRAMGRVLAHELFHVLADTQTHGPSGVAKASYSGKDLVADCLEFALRDVKRLKQH
jgi:hypothetical protein